MSEIIRRLVELQAEEGWLPPDRLATLAAELRVPLHRLESVSSVLSARRGCEGPCGLAALGGRTQ
jgi:NADH:ubiquinone oxidoreductase subunit E